MKKIFLLTVIAAFATAISFGQEQKPSQATAEQKAPDQKQIDQKAQMAKQAAEWDKLLKEELKLTDAQLEKYNAINKDFTDKKEQLMKDASLSADAQKEKKAELKKEKEARFLEILTPEQQAKYKELKDAAQKKKEAQKSGN